MNLFFSIRAIFAATALLATGAASRAESADDLIRKGDAFDQKYQAAEALKSYLPAEKMEPANVRNLVRIARQYRHLMSDATAREEKLRLGGVALGYSQRAAALAPNDAEAQLSVAISYGKILPIEATKDQVEASPRIKVAVDKALKLDPRSDLAWHVLGRWHRVLADVGGVKRALAGVVFGTLPAGSNETAVKCFERAIKLNPNRPMHYIELGITYAQMNRTAEARSFIERGLAMPDTERDDPETKRQGREVLEKLR